MCAHTQNNPKIHSPQPLLIHPRRVSGKAKISVYVQKGVIAVRCCCCFLQGAGTTPSKAWGANRARANRGVAEIFLDSLLARAFPPISSSRRKFFPRCLGDTMPTFPGGRTPSHEPTHEHQRRQQRKSESCEDEAA